MTKWVKKNFFQIIILILLIILLLGRCGGKGNSSNIITERDTTITNNFYFKDSSYTPTLIKTIPVTNKELTIKYVPSENYDSLLKQFESLKKDLLNANVYRDSFKVDTFGYVKITDTIKENKILNRDISHNLKIPLRTITVKEPYIPKNKWFIGGGLAGNKTQLVNDISAGIGLLNKKDNLYFAKARVDYKGNLYYEFNSFWKIRIKK